MTVAELIDVLKDLPPDADVIYQCCSDWALLEPGEVELVTAEQSEQVVQADAEAERRRGFRVGAVHGAVCYRDGRYCRAYPLSMYSQGEKPVYRTVVTLPGN